MLRRLIAKRYESLRYRVRRSRYEPYWKDFGRLERYVMFVGYPRSGHTLVGALLDAHPDMVMAHELDALRHVELGIGREHLFSLLLEASRRFAAGGARGGGYAYLVPNQWNGAYRELKVIGDKKGGGSTMMLARNARLIDELRKTIGLVVHVIHVIRNPFDNISTMARHGGRDLTQTTAHYFGLCRTVQQVRRSVSADCWLDLRHEAMTGDPRQTLIGTGRFLAQEMGQDYLDDCASIVHRSPNRSRLSAPWSDGLIADVERRMREFDYLEGYRFDS